MNKTFAVVAVLGSGMSIVFGQMLEVAPRGVVEKCAAKNGDVNGDGTIDLSDAVTVLGHLFLGSPADLLPLCAPPPVASGLPDTGQPKCYDHGGAEIPCDSATCLGQDALYSTGCSGEGRFLDNGDGTVTDNCTGLMWQKDTGNDARRLKWCDALAYCENLEFAGHDDWRLPNVRELLSIVDYGRLDPAMDPVFGVVVDPLLPDGYWSSTNSTQSPGSLVWSIFSDNGSTPTGLPGGLQYVRAVRLGLFFEREPPGAETGGGRGGGVEKCSAKNGDVNADGTIDLSDAVTVLGHLFLGNPAELAPFCAPAPAASSLPGTGQKKCYSGAEIPCDSAMCAGQDGFYAAGCPADGRFIDNGNGTVTDNCTGLMWQKDPGNDGTPLTWCSALAYCESLELAGHDDWRLPNVRELQSIVDYGRSKPAMDPAFGNFDLRGAWSSTTAAFRTDFAWYVTFGTPEEGGRVVQHSKETLGAFSIYVRAVRRGP